MNQRINQKRRRKHSSSLVWIVASATLTFFAIPLFGIIQSASWSTILTDLSSTEVREALRLSLICSGGAVVLSVLFGTPAAWVLARSNVPGRSLMRGIIMMPMVLPPVVGGVALLSAFGLRSPIGGWLHDVIGLQLTFSTAGAILAETFVAMPFYVLSVEGALRTMDSRFEEVAAGLGARRWMVFRRVTLPLIAPALTAGALLAWARALGEFGATVTFAGNISGRTQTLPLAVYIALESDPDLAIALGLVLLLTSLAVLILLRDRWWSRS